jgi:hypothetical protein
VGPLNQVEVFEPRQVASDGGFIHGKIPSQITDCSEAFCPDGFQYLILSVHGSLPALCGNDTARQKRGKSWFIER